MFHDESVLGIIPARGNSKGLPGKNILALSGKPLIAWSIEAARGSKYLDTIVVSTDSGEIAEIARRFGAETPFLRPPELATDEAPSIDAVEHAYRYYQGLGRRFGYIVLLEPTSPLRESGDIDAALEKMIDSRMDAVVSVCRAEATHPAFLFRMEDHKALKPFQGGDFRPLRRQELEPVYFLEGTVYASKAETLFKKRNFCHEKTIGYEVPKWKSPEIDDAVDFMLVEAIMNHRKTGHGL